MISATRLLKTTIVRKQIVALSGLGLSGFILMHMAANMLILFSPKAYNFYGHNMVNNPLIYVAEAGLLLIFVVHILFAVQLAMDNRKAQSPDGGALSAKGEKSPRFGSRSMILSGLLTLVFVVLHLITFKFGTYYEVTYDGVVVRDLHRLVLEKFNQPLYTAWYLFALVILGVHLSHGISSFFQTLGFGSVRNRNLKRIGYAFAVLVAGGFISQPIYAILVGVK